MDREKFTILIIFARREKELNGALKSEVFLGQCRQFRSKNRKMQSLSSSCFLQHWLKKIAILDISFKSFDSFDTKS